MEVEVMWKRRGIGNGYKEKEKEVKISDGKYTTKLLFYVMQHNI